MKNIKIVFNDIDKCMGMFEKPNYPLKQDLNGAFTGLHEIARKTLDFPEVMFSVATGRSYYLSDNIMRESNHNGPSVFEMGNVIYLPEERSTIYLFERHQKFTREQTGLINEFINWRRKMEIYESKLQQIFPRINLRQMKDRECMLTYEFNGGEEVGRQFYEEVRKLMPGKIHRALEEGVLQLLFCDIAIDILPNIDKGEAVEFILDHYKISRSEALAVGDSSHSDLRLLESVDNIACPQNADDRLKAYVASRGGFISQHPVEKGLLEILNQIN
ncbi:MAG: HAD hydrolase family protein [Nanoarchaeota archaeon]